MITRIEIDGFKSFQKFAVDLAPFQVIIGTNGCGKSNFFDALDLLSHIATSDLRTAFKSIRGDINEVFSILPNNKPVDCMRFAIEMLSEYVPLEETSVSTDPMYMRLRYEIEIQRQDTPDGFENLYIVDERVIALIANLMDARSDHTDLSSQYLPREGTLAKATYVVMEPADYDSSIGITETKKNNIHEFLFRKNLQKMYSAPEIKFYNSDRYPILQRLIAELRKLRLLRLGTSMLRKPSTYFDEPVLTAEGENLPATLARMEKQDKHLRRDVSRDVARIVPNFKEIEVDRDDKRKQFSLYAHMQDKRRFSIDALSEGTLRILALATLRNDPDLRGTVCLEDPEMGVHPGALKRIVPLLRDMATDLDDPESVRMPFRQVLVTTHSPEIVSHLNLDKNELLFAQMATRVKPGVASWQITRMTPVSLNQESSPERSYALDQVMEYLHNPEAAETRSSLREAFLQ